MSRLQLAGIAAAVALAFAPFSMVATTVGVAEAAPCAGAGSNPTRCQWCQYLVAQYHTSNVCSQDAPPRRVQPSPSEVPVQIPPLPTFQPPSTVPVQAPPLNPPNLPPANTVPTIGAAGPDASRNVSVVAPPRGLDVPPQAVAAAKAAPATRVNPADPPKPPQQIDFNQRVQNVVSTHRENVDVLKVDNQRLIRPRHWDYVDYDAYHRPALYNPLNQAMTFRYFYNGADREAYLPAGSRMVLDAATVGLVPFTAVSDGWVASGSFYGGGTVPPDGSNGPPPPDYRPPEPPKVYQNVLVAVPAASQTVEVGQVSVVGLDDSQPAGSRETIFLLNDSTLAWGQVNDSSSASSQIMVTKTQSLPDAGPTDDGNFLVVLAVRPHEEPTQPAQPWWPSALGFGALGLVAGLTAWALNRKRPDDDAVRESVTTSRSSGS